MANIEKVEMNSIAGIRPIAMNVLNRSCCRTINVTARMIGNNRCIRIGSRIRGTKVVVRAI